jgi:hypothetical protein
MPAFAADLDQAPVAATCALSGVSPLHPSAGLPLAAFALAIAVPIAAGTLAGVLPQTGGRRHSAVGLVLRAALAVAGVIAALSAILAALEAGAQERRVQRTREVYEGKKALSDGRPRVVLMIPMRKGLHHEVERKFARALKAMEAGNPTLNLTTFIFDRAVPREKTDDRPLSKVARVRNIMLDEAKVTEDFDYVLWLDSDLVDFPPDLPTALIRVNPDGVTAPMVLIEEPGPMGTAQFYDTTAFIRRGKSSLALHDRSPYYEGRNIGRFYPYVHGSSGARAGATCRDDDLLPAAGSSALANCRRFHLSEVEELDSVGTIYMVAADIFRDGRALYADHLLFTVCMHTRRHARVCMSM